jgi:hypothetical protein
VSGRDNGCLYVAKRVVIYITSAALEASIMSAQEPIKLAGLCQNVPSVAIPIYSALSVLTDTSVQEAVLHVTSQQTNAKNPCWLRTFESGMPLAGLQSYLKDISIWLLFLPINRHWQVYILAYEAAASSLKHL